MDRQPYAPPRTRVVDAPEAHLDRPRQILWGVGLLLLSLALDVLDEGQQLVAVLRASSQGPLVGRVAAIAVVAVIALWTVCIVQTYRGRNWARIVLLVILSIEIFGATSALIYLINTQTGRLRPPDVVGLVSFVSNATGVILLLTPTANGWFRSRGTRPAVEMQ